jgi:hypothetical protein
MSILWVGGEDIDFPNGATATVSTTSSTFRAGYARCSLPTLSTASITRSNAFPGGAVTSAWLSFHLFVASTIGANTRAVGFGLSGTSGSLTLGSGSATNKFALWKYDGTTATLLASETGTSLATSTAYRIDMQVVNFGATATVNVFINGILLITFSGNVAVSGMANFDSVILTGVASGFALGNISEVIVADQDTRAWPGVVTMALTGAGTTNNWTNNTFSNINGTTISDASPASVNVSAQDQQYNVTDLPTGSFVIPVVKISARMAVSASPAVTQVKLGYNSGGTVGFGTGATKLLTTAYATYEQFDSINPVTGLAWAQSDMNALQLELQSLT